GHMYLAIELQRMPAPVSFGLQFLLFLYHQLPVFLLAVLLLRWNGPTKWVTVALLVLHAVLAVLWPSLLVLLPPLSPGAAVRLPGGDPGHGWLRFDFRVDTVVSLLFYSFLALILTLAGPRPELFRQAPHAGRRRRSPRTEPHEPAGLTAGSAV